MSIDPVARGLAASAGKAASALGNGQYLKNFTPQSL